MGGQQNADADQRIKLKKPVYRPAPKLPPAFAKGRNDTEPKEQDYKENLRNSSNKYDFHN
jgi:hypothetical protein